MIKFWDQNSFSLFTLKIKLNMISSISLRSIIYALGAYLNVGALMRIDRSNSHEVIKQTFKIFGHNATNFNIYNFSKFDNIMS